MGLTHMASFATWTSSSRQRCIFLNIQEGGATNSVRLSLHSPTKSFTTRAQSSGQGSHLRPPLSGKENGVGNSSYFTGDQESLPRVLQ